MKTPLEMERKTRETGPVTWTESNGGHWLVSHADAVSEGLRDASNYSTEKFTKEDGEPGGGVMIPTVPFYRYLPNESDPPQWDVFRKSIAQHLSPASVQSLQPLLDSYVTEVIDHMIELGEADFVMQVGSPITALITLHLLGLPPTDWHFYAGPIHALFAAPETAGPGVAAIQVRLAQTIQDRKALPERGLVDDLIAQQADGKALTDDDIKDLVFDVMVGGFDTVAGLMAGAIQWLQDKPEIKQRLIEDQAFLRSANEEFLRYISPAVGLSRTATCDYTIADQEISAGDRIYFMYRSANWDPEEFESPEELDLERMPNPHVAFGSGIHRCVGSNLARAVFRTVIPEFLSRILDYEVVEFEQYRLTNNNAGFAKMIMRYTPGTKVHEEPLFDHI
ncbi:cytochrome P450 [Cryobacterium sp. TMS1-20-1]|uniref:cytochrome P450 n=1 Tax=Cryobacterium sp. TMS1-20-1 TaxID=1259223 RepID=UPI00106D1A24|nr:cytochrome P450 [Cryobacterium sp. TMS1-20-1]TFC70951.1 cytochrome P450 [Cryobacterium sp. TMS1-20-1]